MTSGGVDVFVTNREPVNLISIARTQSRRQFSITDAKLHNKPAFGLRSIQNLLGPLILRGIRAQRTD
jgi:hypothetical protein